jgi:hypothetical protein
LRGLSGAILREDEEGELDGADYPLSLASDMVLPWPWSLTRYIDNVSHIGTRKGRPWKQDKINHYVDLWLPGALALCAAATIP